jgi:hypothetical protein
MLLFSNIVMLTDNALIYSYVNFSIALAVTRLQGSQGVDSGKAEESRLAFPGLKAESVARRARLLPGRRFL